MAGWFIMPPLYMVGREAGPCTGIELRGSSCKVRGIGNFEFGFVLEFVEFCRLGYGAWSFGCCGPGPWLPLNGGIA